MKTVINLVLAACVVGLIYITRVLILQTSIL